MKKEVQKFPIDGMVRAKEAVRFLGMGLSTFHRHVQKGRIRKPVKFGSKISLWDAEYIRELAKNGFSDSAKNGEAA